MSEAGDWGAAETARRSPADWVAAHPEWWSLAISAAAWIVVFGRTPMPALSELCLAPVVGAPSDFADRLRISWERVAGGWMLLDWGVMALAMAPPLAMPLVRHVAIRSFARRRHLALAEFLGGALLAWLIVGVVVLAVLSAAPPWLAGKPFAAALLFLVAALWQFAPAKRRALRRCHRTIALSPTGWRADRDCARYGVQFGLSCVSSCGFMMTASVVGAHSPIVCMCVQLAALAERQARKPEPLSSALILAACGIVAMLQPQTFIGS
jgi:predicted metal-binding membrane protein